MSVEHISSTIILIQGKRPHIWVDNKIYVSLFLYDVLYINPVHLN